MPDVAREVERLHEHLGKDDGGAEVQVDAAAQARDDRGEEAEVAQAPRPDRATVGARMHVDDVGPDRDVDRRRDAGRCRGREDAVPAEREPRADDRLAERAPEPASGRDAVAHGAVHELAGLARHAEEAAVEPGSDVLGRSPNRRELEVVHDAGPVHRDRREPAARDQVDDQRAQADLDGVRAHPEDDGTAPADRGGGARDGEPEVARGENVGKPRDQCANGEPGARRAAERLRGDPAPSPRERYGPYAGEVESGEGSGSPPRASHAVSPNSRRSTSSQITCPTRMWVSWMRAEMRLAETRRLTSTARASSPPSPPVSPTMVTPSSRHASTACRTLGERPLVEIASPTSPAVASAWTWRAKTSS